MERGFEIRSGSIAIGDPAMGLVTFDSKLAKVTTPASEGLCETRQTKIARK
jgi:hypothetical protein